MSQIEEQRTNRKIEPYVLKQFKITLCVLLGNIIIGYTIGWCAPMIEKLKDPLLTPLDHVLSPSEVSWVATIFMPTNLVAINVAGYVANVIGRKPMLMLSSVLSFTGYVIIINASTINMLYLGRIVVGVGFAPLLIINIIYIGEISSPSIRGTIMSMTGIAHVSGSLLVYSVGPYVSYGAVGYIAMAICTLHFICCFYIPESPIYYVIKGNFEAAKAVLHRLGRSSDINTELKAMINNLLDTQPLKTNETETQNQPIKKKRNWLDILTVKANRKSLLITGTLFILQQGCGAMTVIFFATTIFKNAKSSVDPNVGTIILGFTELCGMLITPLLIERSGRKMLMITSASGCSLSMTILGIYYFLNHIKHPIIASIGWLPLVMLIVFLLSFNSGLGIVPNTLLGEMYSPNVRATGSSISFTLGLVSCFLANFTFGYMVIMFGSHGTFWIFAAINAFAVFFTIVFVPETKGKTLTEIQAILSR